MAQMHRRHYEAIKWAIAHKAFGYSSLSTYCCWRTMASWLRGESHCVPVVFWGFGENMSFHRAATRCLSFLKGFRPATWRQLQLYPCKCIYSGQALRAGKMFCGAWSPELWNKTTISFMRTTWQPSDIVLPKESRFGFIVTYAYTGCAMWQEHPCNLWIGHTPCMTLISSFNRLLLICGVMASVLKSEVLATSSRHE